MAIEMSMMWADCTTLFGSSIHTSREKIWTKWNGIKPNGMIEEEWEEIMVEELKKSLNPHP